MHNSAGADAKGSRLSPKTKWVIVGLVAIGTVIRVWLALTTRGVGPDMEAYNFVLQSLRLSRFRAYAEFSVTSHRFWWPYPPGFFPWLVVAGHVAHGGLRFESAIRAPMIVADALLVPLVVHYLRARGVSERALVEAAALIALGPSFVLISGYHGQLDAVMILPAVAAFVVWELSGEKRPISTGLLLGFAATFKTAPALLLIALFPRLRSWGNRVRVAGAAAVVPLVALLPFLLATPSATMHALRYGGLPGFGGLSLVVQPSAATAWFGKPFAPSAATRFIFNNQLLIAAIVFGAVALFLIMRRPTALDGAVIVWLAFYAFIPNFAFQYLVWGLPFFIMAGFLREVLALELFMMVPSVILYARFHLVTLYVVMMLLAWVAFVVAFALQARRIMRSTLPLDGQQALGR